MAQSGLYKDKSGKLDKPMKPQMTDDEYNWSLVMKHEITTPSDSDMWYMVAHHLNKIRTDPDAAKRIYPDIRRVFNRKLNDD